MAINLTSILALKGYSVRQATDGVAIYKDNKIVATISGKECSEAKTDEQRLALIKTKIKI